MGQRIYGLADGNRIGMDVTTGGFASQKMIDLNLKLQLPPPWKGQLFETDKIGPVNFLVGPNGSGKSQFAMSVFNWLKTQPGGARLLGTDRLSGMEQTRPLTRIVGDTFGEGFPRSQFGNLRAAGAGGSGIDTIMLLEERMDLRIQVEATLSHLFNREIIFEWDSGNLFAKVRHLDATPSYRLDREECHGIKELLVLLTHLYDDQHQYLIIDEPELNLHPQYQAFFMQELRKVTGNPSPGGKNKVVFLITHSPFMLDFRSLDDLNSVISFSLDYSVPKQVFNLQLGIQAPLPFIQRLNAHHTQLFFSDNPVFVEGILDRQLIERLMAARFVSVAGAGSCIIDSGGSEEVNHYLKLCQGLGKQAHFLYDLDSFFHGNLRSCIKGDQSIQSFLASSGLGSDFAKYCGQLDQALTKLIEKLLCGPLPTGLTRLGDYLKGFGNTPWEPGQWDNARTAVMTAMSRYKNDMESILGPEVADIEGRFEQIIKILREKNVHLLPGGTIERYLPSYNGDDYQLTDRAKLEAFNAEIQELSKPLTQSELSSRYGDLFDAVCRLPSKGDVDVEPILRNYLSDYVHELQKTVVNNPDWSREQVQQRLNVSLPSTAKVFSVESFEPHQGDNFKATIEVTEMLGQPKRIVRVDGRTNAGMLDFEIELAQPNSEATP